MEEALRRLVWRRAQSRCEYCQLHAGQSVLPFQVDHIIALKPHVTGLTPTGRATVRVLNLNHPDAVALRWSLIEEGVFPP
jgi:hypothetical protein